MTSLSGADPNGMAAPPAPPFGEHAARTIEPNLIATGSSAAAGDQMRYSSLAAAFDEGNHQVYYDLLARAISTEGVRNVALTGAYGTGKSSVLAKLQSEKGDKVVQLSLSTIAPPDRDADAETATRAEPADPAQTNLIQKEIVKQLLYLLPPEKAPRSRFRRASAPNNRREWLIASSVGIVLVGSLLLLGLLQPAVERLVPGPDARWWASYALLAGLVATGVWAVRRLVSGQLSLSASVETGLTTVTLSEKSDTYFDEYLDEIVYFFQESGVEVVVIEDIDRFEDVRVFDTLRALNGLLNGAGSLSRIVFVYAIRDSVFELIGSTSDSVVTLNSTARAVELAGRTKFFDVIVPVVPFLSADNARDLMSQVMTSTEFAIDQGLIRTAARHTADMRLIHNIRNEFEVYRNRLVVPDDHLYGINDNLVFAMVLYKNAHLGDFERIRQKVSSLDDLYVQWRQLVNDNLATEIEKLATLHTRVARDRAADKRAQHLGELALARRDILQAGLQAIYGAQSRVALSGAATEETIKDRAAWDQISSGSVLQYLLFDRYNRQVASMAFTSDELGAFLEIDIDADEWADLDHAEVEKQVAACEERIRFLRHHSWEQLCSRSEFTLALGVELATDTPRESASAPTPAASSRLAGRPTERGQPETKSEQVTFDQLVDRHLLTPLAKEMVRKGYITDHFALYTSTYYGTHLGPGALEYVRRCIEPGQPDALYELAPEAVEQILIEQGASKGDDADIFEDPSIFNVSIVDYLLARRPSAAKKVAARLAVWGEVEVGFVDIYCARGARPDLLVSAMTSNWTGAVQYAAVAAPVSSDMRTDVLDAVLNAVPTASGYGIDGQAREVIEATYEELSAVTSPPDAERAEIVLGLVAAGGAVLESVGSLNDEAREVVVERRLYPVTEANLSELMGGSPIALDALRARDKRIYAHAVQNLDDYLTAFAAAPATPYTINDPVHFISVVKEAAIQATPTAIGTLIEKACPCEVKNLTDAPEVSWPYIVGSGRARPVFENVHTYVTKRGVDDVLALFLETNRDFEWDEAGAPTAARREVVIAILNARQVIPDVGARVRVAVYLEPGNLDTGDIRPERGELPARLIEEHLLADNAETFASEIMTDWQTRESAILASEKYATFVAPETLPVSEVPELLQSRTIAAAVKKAVVDDLESFLDVASQAQAEDLARVLNLKGWQIRPKRIRAVIEKQVSDRETIELIARESQMEVEMLRELLRLMGGEYARLADVGTRPVHLPGDAGHRAVVNRLEGVTVSTYGTNKIRPGQLRINLYRTVR